MLNNFLSSFRFLSISAAIFIFGFAVWKGIDKPLTFDEVEFAAAAKAIVETGKPIYYSGSLPEVLRPPVDRWIFKATGTPEYQYGLWHSSIYLYGLAALYKVTGATNSASRGIGIACLLGVLVLILLLLNDLYSGSRENFRNTASIFAVFFLTSPYIVQLAMMIDFDNTLVALVSSAFLLFYGRLRANPGTRATVLLGALGLAGFWSKEYTPVYLFCAAYLYEIFRGSKQTLIWVVKGSLICLGSSLATWWAFCWFNDFPIDYFIRFSFVRRAEAAALTPWTWTSYLNKVEYSALLSIGWCGVSFWILACWSGFDSLQRNFKNGKRSFDIIAFSTIYAAIILFATKFVRPSDVSLKYEYPAYAAVTLIVGVFIHHNLPVLRKRNLGLGFTLIAATCTFFLLFVGDPVLTIVRGGITRSEIVSLLLLQVVFVVVASFAFQVMSNPRSSSFILGCVCTMIGFNIAMTALQSRDYTTSVTANSVYGEVGLKEVVEFISKEDFKGTLPVFRKDVGFHLNEHYRTKETEQKWIDLSMIDILRQPQLAKADFDPIFRTFTHIVLDSRILEMPENVALFQHHGFTSMQRFGHFIFVRRP
jgi:hypothetical protein